MKKYFVGLSLLLAVVFLVGCGGGSSSSSLGRTQWQGTASFVAAASSSAQISSSVSMVKSAIHAGERVSFSIFADVTKIGSVLEGILSDEFGQSFTVSGSLNGDNVSFTGSTANGTISLSGTVIGGKMELKGTYFIDNVRGEAEIELESEEGDDDPFDDIDDDMDEMDDEDELDDEDGGEEDEVDDPDGDDDDDDDDGGTS